MTDQQKKEQGSASIKRKPGRPAAKKVDMSKEPAGTMDPSIRIAPGEYGTPEHMDLVNRIAITNDRITNLENCLAKMAHFSGSERVLDEFDIERWTVTKESMRKFKG